ncbi:magnesium-translocating P-type ATPase [uncultured Alistipes sp.]|uniref:magnesium-translocating P-type ATPase n=1 Tax=uncultured Alistipes sp. TaxID=538949 RepID=UPI00266B931E|nr:magnesium-translocating P-type ATPase [uncultured Alistipes sp.]
MWKKRSRTQFAFDAGKVFLAATQPLAAVYGYFRTTPSGLSSDEVERRQAQYGRNEVEHERRKNPVTMFIRAFINPFIGILTLLIVVSYVLDVWTAAPEEKEWTTILIIATMILLSVIIRFCQDWRASRSSEALRKMVKNTCSVKRAGREVEELPIEELVPGDIVTLAAGDMIPADVRVIETKDLFVSQSSLTGESEPIEKRPDARGRKYVRGSVVELDNICYMGSNVISGSATAVVFGTGGNTYLGTIARAIVGHRAATAFDRGIARVSLLLIRFMLIMVPFVFLVNGITKGDWLEAFIFAVSVAVGLTPEMLPMIVTANLSKGAVAMSRKKVIVKDLNAIQNFGAMNILCTDKTGTLTCDQIVLERYINADGSADDSRRILRHAYFNSFFQTGLKNLMDRAILAHVRELELESMKDDYRKVDEIPFDFTRRRMSVVVEDRTGKRQIVTKGAVEEMLEICSHTEEGGAVRELTPERIATAKAICERMNHQGLRVLAVAHRSFLGKEDNFSVGDERDMVLIGFLAFLDPPKPSAESAIRQLQNYGIEVKVLSGDNDAVVRTVARQVGITGKALTGRELEELEGEELRRAVQEASVFSKVTPLQKTQIITLLQEAQHTVGFLGDGINDAAALRQSDIGISVDSAVDIAKESADIILLEKDLMVLGEGVVEGRRTFGNIVKYIKMTASSNFGNMFSVMAASAFLPFLPMMPIHLLVQNLLYDISQTTIPFDRMDAEYLRKPRKWDASGLSRFMIWIGPISSIFDLTTYLLMWYLFQCRSAEMQALFQSGWFVEGLLSQTLIVHMIRTRKIPFIQSRASWPVMAMTFAIMAFGIAIPFTPFGASIGLVALPWSYFPWLAATLTAYCVLTQAIKNRYVKRFNSWL